MNFNKVSFLMVCTGSLFAIVVGLAAIADTASPSPVKKSDRKFEWIVSSRDFRAYCFEFSGEYRQGKMVDLNLCRKALGTRYELYKNATEDQSNCGEFTLKEGDFIDDADMKFCDSH